MNHPNNLDGDSGSADTRRGERTVAVALEAIALLVFIGYYIYFFYTPVLLWDDAYMFLRYARNFNEGHGWTWNPGAPPANGVTSPLWLFTLIAAEMVSSDRAVNSGAILVELSFGASFLYLIVAYFAIRTSLPWRLRPAAVLFPYWIGFGDFYLPNQATSGMETLLASALLAAYVFGFHHYLSSLERGAPRLGADWLLGIGAILLYLIRPEFGLFAVFTPVCAWVFRAPGAREHTRKLLLVLAISSAGIALYHQILRWIFHSPLPLPFYVKGSLLSIPYEKFQPDEAISYILQGLSYFGEMWPIHCVVFAGLLRKGSMSRFGWLAVPLVLSVLYLMTIFPVMGYGHRYYYPFILPEIYLAILCWSDAIERLAAGAVDGRHVVKAWALPAAALAYGALIWLYGLSLPGMRRWGGEFVSAQQVKIIETWSSRLPPGTRIAATEVGALGHFGADAIIHDLAGLNDAEFCHGFDADALFARRVDIITSITSAYGGIFEGILGHPEFANFEPVGHSMPPAGALDLHATIWVHRDAPNREAILLALRPFR